jgi:hypothetical protein
MYDFNQVLLYRLFVAKCKYHKNAEILQASKVIEVEATAVKNHTYVFHLSLRATCYTQHFTLRTSGIITSLHDATSPSLLLFPHAYIQIFSSTSA